jgi:C4-type Zn-finger protein
VVKSDFATITVPEIELEIPNNTQKGGKPESQTHSSVLPIDSINDIIPLLRDSWVDESKKQMKKTLKTKILETVPAKCDS